MPDSLETIPARALAIYAHPDDPEVSCGGTLAHWSASGAEVHVVVVTSGDKGSQDPGTDPAELVACRRREVAAAAARLGLAGHHLLGHPDGEIVDGPELRGELVALIRRLQPEAVVCPDPTAAFFGQHYFNHRDHRIVGWAALDAVAPAAWSPLYFPAAGAPHRVEDVLLSGTLEADAWVDITDTIDVKVEAVLCHASQVSGPPESIAAAVRHRAEEGGRQAGMRYAEGFRRLRLGV